MGYSESRGDSTNRPTFLDGIENGTVSVCSSSFLSAARALQALQEEVRTRNTVSDIRIFIGLECSLLLIPLRLGVPTVVKEVPSLFLEIRPQNSR